MGVIQFVRKTPLYLSPVIVKIDGQTHKLKSNQTLTLELPSMVYEVLVCNEYEKFEGREKVNITDDRTTVVEVGLKNTKAYQILLIVLLLVAFLLLFYTQISSLVLSLAIIAVLGAYWGIEYYNRKSYFVLTLSTKENEQKEEVQQEEKK